ncbi:MAG: ParA family protein [Candidatus Dormibacteria bacterium]
MTTVISIASGKGGVGKTTTTANLAVAFGRQGLKVLAWDMDGQGNLGQALGLGSSAVQMSSYHLLTQRLKSLSRATYPTAYENVTLIPAQMELFAAEQELGGGLGKEFIVRGLLAQPDGQEYDVVLVDLPPNLGFQTINGLAASRFVLVPLQMSGFALSGLRQLAHAVRLVQDLLNPELELLGLLPTFVSERTTFSRELLEALTLIPGTRVFQPHIPYTVKVAEGSLTGVPVVASAPNSAAARAYVAVAAIIWDAIQAEPARVERAPAPTIAAPPRAAVVPVMDLAEQLRDGVEEAQPAKRKTLLDWVRRVQRSTS